MTFVRTFRGLTRALGITQECLQYEIAADKYIRRIHKMLKQYGRLILFAEASIGDVNITSHFRQIKDALDDRVVIICLSTEMDRDVLCLFHELGADNIIVKPVSINSIIEKIAYTIKPNNMRNLVGGAKEAIEKGEFDTARKAIDELLEINAESSIANILLGDIHRINKEYDEAEARYKSASSKARMYLEPMERLVELYNETGNVGARIAMLEKLDKLSPLNHKRKIVIGDAYTGQGDVSKAREFYNGAVSVVRKHARDQVVVSLMEVGQKVMDADPEQGLSYMNEAMEMKSDDFTMQDMWMFNEIGRNLRKQGKWEEAVSYYTTALGIAPDNGGLYYNLAMAYLQGKSYFKALEYANKALDRDPDLLGANVGVPYSLARICFHTERYAQSNKYIRMVLQKDPDHQGAMGLQKRLQKNGV